MVSFVVTCEHASNRLPASARGLFRGHAERLRSHSGWDPGAAAVARELARLLRAPLLSGRHSRLLVDLNRSATNQAVFSSVTRALPPAARDELLARYHAPHWGRVHHAIGRVPRGTVFHVAVHSFVPVLEGKVRAIDVGLLYDPARTGELQLCDQWRRRLRAAQPELRVRRNAPYRGRSDGLPSALRTLYPPERYVGVELELNQAWLRTSARGAAPLLARTLRASAASV